VKPKRYSYYTIDTGFLGAPVKLCFTKEAFQEILTDHNIQTKETALGLGLAETHYFTQDRNGLIIVVFDLNEMVDDIDFSNIFATITHESVHIVHRIMDYVGEEEPGEEIQAYLTEHIAKQILKGITTEQDKRARTGIRKTAKPTSKAGGGHVTQMDQHSERSAGQDSLFKQAGSLHRIEDCDRDS